MTNYDPFFDFTGSSRHILSHIVNNPNFKQMDSDMIFDGLSNYLVFVPLSSFLKRQLYKKMNLTDAPESITDDVYKEYVIQQFKDNNAATSLDEKGNKTDKAIEIFVTRIFNDKSAKKREDVFVLGFGLKMSTDEVRELLVKALNEPSFNAKNPIEDICYYCFKNGYGYSKFKTLKEQFDNLKITAGAGITSENTFNIRTAIFESKTDEELINAISGLKTASGESQFSVTAWETFQGLYNKAAELILEDKQRLADEKYEKALRDKRDKVTSGKSKTSLTSVISKDVEKITEKRKTYTIEDVSTVDFENVMNSSIPKKGTNLPKTSLASLGSEFASKGLRRGNLSKTPKEVSRYDLINLNFFIHAKSSNIYLSRNQRMKDFLESTNSILQTCNMGPIYAGNPYECFIVMCMVSGIPLATYADVWALTYGVDEEKLNELKSGEAEYERE